MSGNLDDELKEMESHLDDVRQKIPAATRVAVNGQIISQKEFTDDFIERQVASILASPADEWEIRITALLCALRSKNNAYSEALRMDYERSHRLTMVVRHLMEEMADLRSRLFDDPSDDEDDQPFS